MYQLAIQFSSVQSLSRVWLFATPWIAARQASLSITMCKKQKSEAVYAKSVCAELLIGHFSVRSRESEQR